MTPQGYVILSIAIGCSTVWTLWTSTRYCRKRYMSAEVTPKFYAL